MELSRLVVKGLSRLAMFVFSSVADRIVAHRAVPLNRAQRHARCLQPFARGPDGIAARRALAFQHPHRLLPGPSSRAACIESGMGKGTDRSEDRCNGGKEGVPGVVARIGPTSPSPTETRLNALPCPAAIPTAAWTSSCARIAAICAGIASGAWARSGRMNISKWPSPMRRLSQHSPIALPFAPLLVKPIATRQGRDAGMAAR